MRTRVLTLLLTAAALLAGMPPAGRGGEPTDAEHLARLAKKDKVSEAVDKGLAYLVSVQDPVQGCFKGDKPNTLTGLSCLALMAAGHFPGRSKYGDNLRAGILYLVRATEKDKGYLGNEANARMYGHGICAVALCEAYGMMQKEEDNHAIRKAIDRAIAVILNAQMGKKESPLFGGWRYSPQAGDADLSVTAWQILALRSAQNCKLDVPEAAISNALVYLRRSFNPSQQGFAYQPNGTASPAMRSAGVVCMLALGANKSDEDKARIDRSAEFLASFDPAKGNHFYYQSYYVATAANMLGDKQREAMLPKLERVMMTLQMPGGEFRRHSDEQGEVYSTAFGVICLCVRHQYLPIYQE